MKKKRQYAKKAGMAPGKIVFTGEAKLEKPEIRVIRYNENNVTESRLEKIEESLDFMDISNVTWLDISGLHEVRFIEDIGNTLKIHPLVLEDIVHTSQRPKMEEFDDYIFLVLKMFYLQDEEITEEQVSMIIGDNYVVTFQEKPGDVFDQIRDRIRNRKSRIVKQKSDYLAYAIIDAIVDNYFVIMESLGGKIELMEDDLLIDPSDFMSQEIHTLKKEIISLKRSVWPLREMINKLDRTESVLINDSTRIFIRDVYDHTIQVMDLIENYKDILSGMLDTYLSSLSNRMNEVMKTLTIISTIFIPLTFIAGIYGMNFEYMPELKWHWGYFASWFVMIFIAVCLIVYFRKKRWL